VAVLRGGGAERKKIAGVPTRFFRASAIVRRQKAGWHEQQFYVSGIHFFSIHFSIL